MAIKKFVKQPADRLNYEFDYTEWADGTASTGSTYTYTADPGITIDDHYRDDWKVVLRVGGGTDGQTYKVTVLLTTGDGEIKESEALFRIKEIA